jgi:hypothetical protein
MSTHGWPEESNASQAAALIHEREDIAAKLAEAIKDNRELEAEVERLQIALDFWLPNIPATGPEKLIKRMTHDAWLLAGLDGEKRQTAEDLGWAKLTEASDGAE